MDSLHGESPWAIHHDESPWGMHQGESPWGLPMGNPSKETINSLGALQVAEASPGANPSIFERKFISVYAPALPRHCRGTATAAT